MKALHLLTLFFISLAVFNSCKKDAPVNPAAPDTQLYVSQINLEGKDRLPSTVEMHWSGSDKDGFVKSYEFSFDNNNWYPTTRTDSTFHFSLTSAQTTADIQFYVRAVDNEGLKDPSPAHVTIPIKNSPPTVLLTATTSPKDTAYGVFSLEWTARDKDGDATIDSTFIRLNDGTWYYLNPAVSFVTIVPENIKGSGRMQAQVYKDLSAVLLGNKIGGLNMAGQNKVYVRVRDIAGSYSTIDSTSFYLKPQKSDLLVLNATGVSPNPSEIFQPIISSVYGKYDYIDFARDNQKYLPAYWTPTFRMLIRFYDKVFIYSDEQKLGSGKLVLEAASAAFADYLNHGGKLLVSSYYPNNLDYTSTIRDFAPVDSFATNKTTAQARIPIDSALVPDPANATGYPKLIVSNFIVGADPFYPKDAKVMYRAQLSKVGGWKGPNNVIAKTVNSQGQTNEVFSSVDLSYLNNDPQALKDFFSKVLLYEFNW